MFYEIQQNNTGGSFDTDDKLCHRLIIEADNKQEANDIAENLGCYWNGVDEGKDCSCCGDRWYGSHQINIEKWQKEGYPASVYKFSNSKEETEKKFFETYGDFEFIETPHWFYSFGTETFGGMVKFRNIEEYAQFMSNEYGGRTTPETRIFYKNGEVKELFTNKNKYGN